MEKTRLDRVMDVVLVVFCLAVLVWVALLVLGAGWL